jgi:hypothetical protein
MASARRDSLPPRHLVPMLREHPQQLRHPRVRRPELSHRRVIAIDERLVVLDVVEEVVDLFDHIEVGAHTGS